MRQAHVGGDKLFVDGATPTRRAISLSPTAAVQAQARHSGDAILGRLRLRLSPARSIRWALWMSGKDGVSEVPS
jgi:hypothetical protein